MEQKFPIKILIFETTKYQLQRETKDLCKLFLNYFPGTKGFDNRREIYILSIFFTFEGFKSWIFDKNGLEKLKKGICTRQNRVTKL